LWEKLVEPNYDPVDLDRSWQHAQRKSPGRKTRLSIGPDPRAPFRKQFGIATYPPPPPSEAEAKLLFDPQFIQYEVGGTKKRDVFGELDEGQMVVWLNLSFPIGPQLETAKKIFLEEQTAQTFSNVNQRARTDKYTNYLRVLDAVDDGADPKGIAAILYPRLSNKHPDYNGSQTVRDDIKAAMRLRDHDFGKIALFKKK
jgi:hypothetical protein